ncbi:hypothetical protein LOAG_13740, partial [Loa loa]
LEIKQIELNGIMGPVEFKLRMIPFCSVLITVHFQILFSCAKCQESRVQWLPRKLYVLQMSFNRWKTVLGGRASTFSNLTTGQHISWRYRQCYTVQIPLQIYLTDWSLSGLTGDCFVEKEWEIEKDLDNSVNISL